MQPQDRVRTAYTLLPPPISGLPAKYHAPISLLLHSLSTGWVSSDLSELLRLDEEEETLAFILGVTHDIHQKLVKDGLSSPKTAKAYLREKLDELSLREYYRYVESGVDVDACGKHNPVKGVPEHVVTLCHIGDMVQGRFQGLQLLYWLRETVQHLDKDLTVRYYGVMIPQPFARSYITLKLYNKYIRSADQVTLTSPWGLYVITYEDELPEVLEASWDDLRVGCDEDTAKLVILDYESIAEAEKEGKTSIPGAELSISKDELRNKLWSRFARLFYCRELLGGDEPMYPVLDRSIESLFVNISFTDVEFRDIKPEEAYICGLCGTLHLAEQSLPLSMYGTKRGVKIAGVRVTTEKWNRFLPAHIKVKTFDSRGTWSNRIGMCPLCTLDALGIRYSELQSLAGFVSLSVAKPLPLGLLAIIGRSMREVRDQAYKGRGTGPELAGIVEEAASASTGISMGRGLVVDFSSATVSASAREPLTDNMFNGGDLVFIGKLLELGFYPLKYTSSIDTTVSDRLLVTPVSLPVADFPVTSKKYSLLVPYVSSLLSTAGGLERSKAMRILSVTPSMAPLALLSTSKGAYDHVASLLRSTGVAL